MRLALIGSPFPLTDYSCTYVKLWDPNGQTNRLNSSSLQNKLLRKEVENGTEQFSNWTTQNVLRKIKMEVEGYHF